MPVVDSVIVWINHEERICASVYPVSAAQTLAMDARGCHPARAFESTPPPPRCRDIWRRVSRQYQCRVPACRSDTYSRRALRACRGTFHKPTLENDTIPECRFTTVHNLRKG